MKKITVIACLLALLTLSACGAQTLPADEKDVPPVEGISQTQEDGQTGTKVVYIPMWMQDYSVVYYDAHLNRTVESGGDLTEEEINSREAMVRRYSLRYSIKEVPIVFLKYFMKCDWLSPTSAEISAIVMRSI